MSVIQKEVFFYIEKSKTYMSIKKIANLQNHGTDLSNGIDTQQGGTLFSATLNVLNLWQCCCSIFYRIEVADFSGYVKKILRFLGCPTILTNRGGGIAFRLFAWGVV
jgi:hypothetical protein